jgi:nucleoid DNA-binding protein
MEKLEFINLLQQEWGDTLSKVERIFSFTEDDEIQDMAVGLARMILQRGPLKEATLARMIESTLREAARPSIHAAQVKISKKTTSALLHRLFQAVQDRLSSGDEVRVSPWGKFYPKKIHQHGDNCERRGETRSGYCTCKIRRVKLGFRSFPKTDNTLTNDYRF